MATLAVGSAAGRVLGILSVPILTRLYMPDDYGVFALFVAAVSILSPLMTGRYVLAIPHPKTSGGAVNLAAVSFLLMIGSMIILILTLYIWHDAALSLFSMREISPIWWLIPIASTAIALNEMLSMWATRKCDYSELAASSVIQSLAGGGTKVGLGLASQNFSGLMLGHTASAVAGSLHLILRFRKDFYALVGRIRIRRMVVVVRRYKGFPIWRIPSQLLLVTATHSPLIFIAAIFGVGTTGQFGLAMTALALPISLIANTAAQAFFAEVSSAKQNSLKQVHQLFLSVVIQLAAISLLPTLVLLICAEPIFVTIFGHEWKLAGATASLMSFSLFFQFLQAPVAYVFFIFNANRSLFFLNVQRVTLCIIVFTFAHLFVWSYIITILTFSVVSAAHYAYSVFYTSRFISTMASGNR